MSFSARIQEAMRRQDLGLRELCRDAGLDPSFFSKVLSGKRSPPSDEAVLRRLAARLGFDPVELIALSGRFPSEWEASLSDRALFGRIHELATGHKSKEPRDEGRFRPPALSPRPSFGEELL